jgi:hypothetical protein
LKVLIIDIDSTIPNLALKKIEKYHLDLGDEVVWNLPLYRQLADQVYVSCIFNKIKDRCFDYEDDPKCLIGGSGYDLKVELPNEIEEVKPHINLGFTTRGCIRNCYFCIVPQKEGKVHIYNDIYDIWDGVSKEIILMDNNILALPNHFKLICQQLRKEKLKVDFNQGLDFRLLTENLWIELKSLKHLQEKRFAFDDISYKEKVIEKLELMKKIGLKDWETRWYVYIGVNDTFKTVFERMEILRSYKQGVYVMRDEKVYKNKEFMALACWGNCMGAFKLDLKDVLNNSKRLNVYKKYFESEGGY